MANAKKVDPFDLSTRDIRQHSSSRTTWAPEPSSIFCAIHRKCPANSASSLPGSEKKIGKNYGIAKNPLIMVQYGSIVLHIQNGSPVSEQRMLIRL
jgi:hypothetical protein